MTYPDSHVSTTTDRELGVGVLHDLNGLCDLVGTAGTEHTLRVHDLVVRPELLGLVLVDIVVAVEDGVGDMLIERIAAIGAAFPLGGGRSRGREKQWRNKGQHGCLRKDDQGLSDRFKRV